MVDRRKDGLGALAALTDPLLLRILSFLNADALGTCQRVSHAFFVLSNEDVLWKPLCLTELQGNFQFTRSWKVTLAIARIRARPAWSEERKEQCKQYLLRVHDKKFIDGNDHNCRFALIAESLDQGFLLLFCMRCGMIPM